MPCPCCGHRLPGDPPRAFLDRERARIRQIRRYHTNHWLAMGLRAEGLSEKEIARVKSLAVGMGLTGRRRLRDTDDYAPGMVQRWGKHIVITR